MRKKYLVVLALMAGLLGSASAQKMRSCATMQHLQMQQAQDPGLDARMQQIEKLTQSWISNQSTNKTTTIITIPVVVHVIYNTASQNISDAQVQSQIDVLNEDYHKLNADVSLVPSVFTSLVADCQIQFCLAKRDPNGATTTGIIHKSTTVSSFSSNDNIKHNANGGDDAWPMASYLNIWVGNLGGGLLGYAQFPGGAAATDGVVILYNSFGRIGTVSAPYDKGRSATHEIGHWLNLHHVWGDANCGDDLVADTPTQQTSNFGCPAFPHVTCSNGPNGDMFMNYMDYTDDACMFMFSNGQLARMNATINGTRAGLLTSQGCVPPVVGACNVTASLTTASITSSSATLSWAAVSGAASYNVQYRVVGATSWIAGSSSTTSLALSGLSASTNYEFQVQTVCSGTSSSAFSGSGTFSTTAVAACNVPGSLSAASITSGSATLNWGAVSGAASYNVQYRIVGATSWIATTSTTNSKAISGLTASSNYEFQVQTVCSGTSSSAFSASGTFTTSAVSTGCSDPYEPNNTRATATVIAVNTDINGLIGVSGDIDYFKFVTTTGLTNIKITLDQLPFDYDLRLYNSSGSTLSTSQNGGTTAEQIIRNTTTAATYYVRVYGYSGANSATSCYHLKVNTSASTFRGSNADNTEGNINLQKVNGIDAVNLFPNPASNVLGLNFFIAEHNTVTMQVIDVLGKTIMNQNINAEEGFNQTQLNVNDLNNGIYFLRVQQNNQVIVKKFVVKH